MATQRRKSSFTELKSLLTNNQVRSLYEVLSPIIRAKGDNNRLNRLILATNKFERLHTEVINGMKHPKTASTLLDHSRAELEQLILECHQEGYLAGNTRTVYIGIISLLLASCFILYIAFSCPKPQTATETRADSTNAALPVDDTGRLGSDVGKTTQYISKTAKPAVNELSSGKNWKSVIVEIDFNSACKYDTLLLNGYPADRIQKRTLSKISLKLRTDSTYHFRMGRAENSLHIPANPADTLLHLQLLCK